jgi:hypothetical protein
MGDYKQMQFREILKESAAAGRRPPITVPRDRKRQRVIESDANEVQRPPKRRLPPRVVWAEYDLTDNWDPQAIK